MERTVKLTFLGNANSHVPRVNDILRGVQVSLQVPSPCLRTAESPNNPSNFPTLFKRSTLPYEYADGFQIRNVSTWRLTYSMLGLSEVWYHLSVKEGESSTQCWLMLRQRKGSYSWHPKTNCFLGIWREHAHKISTQFVNEDDCGKARGWTVEPWSPSGSSRPRPRPELPFAKNTVMKTCVQNFTLKSRDKSPTFQNP